VTGTPDLSSGLCQPGKSPLPPDTWLGGDNAAARRACASCPVLDACRDWVLALPEPPPFGRHSAIIAGMSIEQRRAARKALG
jgi:Transcription factor WhiB